LEPGEAISVNAAFKNANIRVTVMPVPSGKEKEEGREAGMKENMDGILRERSMHIDAHCVKHMKANKVLIYNDLLSKVMASVQNFKAQPQQIKLRI
jgi:hypothetical protein